MKVGPGNASPFVARERDLSRVFEAWSSGRCGAFVSGRAGLGKTRLLDELATRARSDEVKVVAVSALESLRDIPLGAVVAVLGTDNAGGAGGSDPGARLNALAEAFDLLAAGRDRETLVLVIDDAHHLDDTTAALAHQMAQSKRAFVVFGATESATLPAALDALGRGDLVERIDLDPLDAAGVGELCSAALGGIVDAPTRRRLGHASGGSPRYLRELIAAGLAANALVRRENVWSWHGPLVAGARLSALVETSVASAGAGARELLDLLALCDGIELDVLLDLVGPDAIDAAESAGLVAINTSAPHAVARLAHPLFALALRENMTAITKRRLAGSLADALTARVGYSEEDSLRVVELEIDAHRAHDPGALLKAAAQARSLDDLELWERLARAAGVAGANPAAQIELDECLIWQGRFREVEVDPEPAASSGLDPELVARRARAHASAAFFGLGNEQLGNLVLDRAEARLGEHCLAADVRSHRAELAMFSGSFENAIRLAREVLADETALPVARATAFGALVPSLALTGLVDDAPIVADEALAFMFSQPDPPLWEGAGVIVGQFLAALFSGRLAELDPIISGLYGDAAGKPLDPMRGVWALMLGRSALARGDLVGSVEFLSEAAALLRENDPGRVLAWCLGSLAQAAGQLGDASLANAAAREMTGERIPAMHAYNTDLDIGTAWARSAEGGIDDARRMALGAATSALEHDARGAAAWALHEALRLGAQSEDVARIRIGAVQGPLFAATARLPDAMRQRDVATLLAVIDQLSACDAHLWAAEIAAVAGVRADEQGLPGLSARALVGRSRELALCSGARTPLLTWTMQRSSRAGLTARELEISDLAAQGLGNADIAHRLFLSRRTVENHLASVYRKLGTSSRAELVGLLAPNPDESDFQPSQ